MEKLRISLWVLIVLFWYTSVCFGCTEEERNGLLKFQTFVFDQNNSENSDCCRWDRVKCDNTTRRIVRLNLSHIYGDVYDEHVLDASLLLPFPQLQYLNLSFNRYSILQNQQDLGRLNKLEVLDLSYNDFVGIPIFQYLSTLSSLTVLHLSAIGLNGSLSDVGRGLCKLRNLRELYLRQNKISVLQNHQDLRRLNKLEVLDLSDNFFDDTRIFQYLSTLTSLIILNLSENGLNGSLSDVGRDLCKLRNLQKLNLDRNKITGSIPPCFENLTSLKVLDLSSNNYFDGLFLQDLGRLNKLEVLDLSDNSLNDSRIFQSLSTLTFLTVLDLSENPLNASLSDINGRDLCKLRNLRELYLIGNKLSGSIPPCFDNLTSLKALDLSKNNLVGFHFPSLLVTSLEYLSLDYNPQFDASTMLTSWAGREFQLRYLGLKRCNINISTTYLLKILHNGPKLLILDLSDNNLHEELPISLFEKSSNLKFFSLRNNSLTGRLHLSVNHLVNLKRFDISYNHIQGELQPNLGHVLPNLLHLDIGSNNFGGEIPISIYTMKHLEVINLSNNNFSGKIPERLGLSCKRLHWIDLSNNGLEGQIPDKIFYLKNLSVFSLSNNQISGHIPSVNFRLFNLAVFTVNQNRISGGIPSWLCNLTDSLLHLDLSQNQLSGPVPSCLFNMSSLINLSLQRNNLTGTFPKALTFDPYLSIKVLDVSHNDLSGTIPNWLGHLSDLVVLSLKGNRFTGPIPHELCGFQNMGIMDISHNILYGPIPICFTNITFGRWGITVDIIIDYPAYWSTFDKNMFPDLIVEPLTYKYDLYVNITISELENVQFNTKSRIYSYKGEIITHMFGIDLSCNNLDGVIPLDIGAIIELRGLNLSHNQFTGVIPSSLSNMKQIESLDLSNNKLSGGIPWNLTVLTTLEVFSVAYNNLSGRLPEMVAQFSTFSETSYEGNPFLCGPPLLKQCNTNSGLANTTNTLSRGDDKFGIDRTSFLASFAATYATFLLAFVIVLCINPHWRRRWFYFIDVCMSFVFPFWSKAIHRRRI